MVVLCFWLGFALTLAAAAGTIVTGLRHLRRAHFVMAPITLVVLGWTIYWARRLTSARVLPEPELEFHLIFARSAAILLLPVIGTGLWLARSTGRSSRIARAVHRIAVSVWLLAVVTATVTGVYMYSLSSPRG